MNAAARQASLKLAIITLLLKGNSKSLESGSQSKDAMRAWKCEGRSRCSVRKQRHIIIAQMLQFQQQGETAANTYTAVISCNGRWGIITLEQLPNGLHCMPNS